EAAASSAGARSLGGELGHERAEGVVGRAAREAMLRAGAGPGEALVRAGLDPRHEPGVLVEHRRAEIDELVQAFGPREEPALAVRAVMVAARAVEPADLELALDDLEPGRGQEHAERE